MQDIMSFAGSYMLPLRAAAFAAAIAAFFLSFRQWIYAKKITPGDLTEIPGVQIRLIMLAALMLALCYIDSALFLAMCLLLNTGNIFLIKKMTNSLTRIGYNIYITDNLMDGRRETRRPDLMELPLFFLEPSFDSYLESCSFLGKEEKKYFREKSAALEDEKTVKSVFD